MRCRACGSTDIEDEGVSNPAAPEVTEPYTPSYRELRERDKRTDWQFFRARMDDVDVEMEGASSRKRKEAKRVIYELWRDFHDEKYGKGGRKCFAGSFADCQMQAQDPVNYPWDRDMVVEQWWEANKP